MPAAAKALIGTKLDAAALEKLAAACSAACKPIDDKRGTIEFRTKVAGVLARRAAEIALQARRRKIMSGVHVSTTINGDAVEFVCEPTRPLLDVLRNRLGMTGAKEGCGTGDCGACSVTVDGRLVCSCLVLGAEVEGRQGRNHRRHGQRRQAASPAEKIHRPCGAAMRHLHARAS